MKIQSVVRRSVVQLCVVTLLALPAVAQAAGNAKSSSQTALGVPCSEIFERGIDKQENLRAGMIRVGCGLEAPGEAGEASARDSVLDLINLNLITGLESFPSVTQSESMVWSRQDLSVVVVAYNDSRDRSAVPINISGVSVSFDGGNTFERISPHSPFVGHGGNFGDPVVVFNERLGRWYAGFLVDGCGASGIGMWTSTDAMNWTAAPCAHSGRGDDRESMWVDNDAASPFYGRMYISWNDFSMGEHIFVTHSDDGITWSAPRQVETRTVFMRNIQLTGSPDDGGKVFIAAMEEGGGGGGRGNAVNYMYRSVDGDASPWTEIQQGPPFAPPGQPICGYFWAIPPIWRHEGWGQPAVGPNGVVHYVYAGKGSNPGDEGDIFYTRSFDDGDTWSTPIVLNTDAAAGGNRSQWMPSLSATPEGQVVVSWFDRRNTTDFSYEFWGIRSPDNGLSWASDERFSGQVIPQPEQPDPGIQGCYAGDYNYHSAVTGKSWVTWTDGRVPISGHNQQDVFFAAVDQVITGGTLQGTVTDTTGAVVVGARVQAVGPVTRAATTNRDGTYRFIGVAEGAYDMTVTAPDYNQATATGVAVVEGQTTTQDFVLTGQGILEGTVIDSQGMVIAGARVQAVGPVTRTAMTDSNGFYRLRLVVGTYDVTVTIFAYDPATASVQVLDGLTTQNFTLTLSPVHSISGTITAGVTGLPVPNATVRVLNTPIPPATSDTNGMYQIPSVPDGTYDLQASPPPGSGLSPKTVSIVVNMDVTVDFVLDAAALHINFEPPDYQGSATGIRVTGQQGWYVPNVSGSTDEFIFTYDGNALGLPPNLTGDTQLLGARVSQQGSLNRAQLDYDWSASTVWTVSYDLAVRWNGTLPAVDNNSSFSLQDSTTARYFIALNQWADAVQATRWNANYQAFTANNVLLTFSAGPDWQNLPVNHWFRESTSFDFDSNRIISVSITDLDTGVTATFAPTDWYLNGGATGRPPLPTALRFFIGGDSVTLGNTTGWDNLDILTGGPQGGPGRSQSHSPQVMPLVPGAETN